MLEQIIKARVIIGFVERQDPYKLGESFAKIVDEIFDKEFGGKRSEVVQKKIAPFLNKIMMAFNNELLNDIPK